MFLKFLLQEQIVSLTLSIFNFIKIVGCDEEHPEEMDSEVVYKNFVMRVCC